MFFCAVTAAGLPGGLPWGLSPALPDRLPLPLRVGGFLPGHGFPSPFPGINALETFNGAGPFWKTKRDFPLLGYPFAFKDNMISCRRASRIVAASASMDPRFPLSAIAGKTCPPCPESFKIIVPLLSVFRYCVFGLENNRCYIAQWRIFMHFLCIMHA